MEFLFDYLSFVAKAITIVVAIIVVIGLIAQAAQQAKDSATQEHIEVKKLNERFEAMQKTLESQLVTPEEHKLQAKQEKKLKKAEHKANKQAAKRKAKQEPSTDIAPISTPKKRLFVIDFDGDIRASAVDSLREEITAILTVAQPDDQVMVRLESPGGVVHGYGLAASQLQRIKDAKIKLTACVDKVAASGGYMMACVADEIVAAPFSIIGSIGVVAQLPNFHRFLKKHDIDYEQHTAGEYKRTVTVFGENTDDDRAKFKQELEETHGLFKHFVADHRPNLDVSKVATGEHWHGIQALELGLVDTLSTSDDYLLKAHAEQSIFQVKYVAKKTLSQKLNLAAQTAFDKLTAKLPRT